MTNKMRRIQSRIEKLTRLLAAKPIPTPPIIQMALQLTSGEDLMVLRRIIKAVIDRSLLQLSKNHAGPRCLPVGSGRRRRPC